MLTFVLSIFLSVCFVFIILCAFYMNWLIAYREEREAINKHNQWLEDNKIELQENNSSYWRN